MGVGHRDVYGAVTIGDHCGIWFGSVVRADSEIINTPMATRLTVPPSTIPNGRDQRRQPSTGASTHVRLRHVTQETDLDDNSVTRRIGRDSGADPGADGVADER
jgi:hypothetical protein